MPKSARQVARRLVEDLAFRYLGAGERVDNWALSAFRRRHRRALNDAFTPVLEWAQSQVASGEAGAGGDRLDAHWGQRQPRQDRHRAGTLRSTRAALRRQVRQWQKQADRDDQEPGGLEVAIGELNQALAEMPRRLEKLNKSGLKKLSRTDEDAAFSAQARRIRTLRLLGRDRRLRRITSSWPTAGDPVMSATDNESQRAHGRTGATALRRTTRSGAGPTADSSPTTTLKQLEQRRNIDAYIPTSNMAQALNLGTRRRTRACHPAHRRMRGKPAISGRTGRVYARRKAIAEPPFGVLETANAESTQFRTRGLEQRRKRPPGHSGSTILAYNITRLYALRTA